jgi:hypothetical protein
MSVLEDGWQLQRGQRAHRCSDSWCGTLAGCAESSHEASGSAGGGSANLAGLKDTGNKALLPERNPLPIKPVATQFPQRETV